MIHPCAARARHDPLPDLGERPRDQHLLRHPEMGPPAESPTPPRRARGRTVPVPRSLPLGLPGAAAARTRLAAACRRGSPSIFLAKYAKAPVRNGRVYRRRRDSAHDPHVRRPRPPRAATIRSPTSASGPRSASPQASRSCAPQQNLPRLRVEHSAEGAVPVKHHRQRRLPLRPERTRLAPRCRRVARLHLLGRNTLAEGTRPERAGPTAAAGDRCP